MSYAGRKGADKAVCGTYKHVLKYYHILREGGLDKAHGCSTDWYAPIHTRVSYLFTMDLIKWNRDVIIVS
jgi:hypothetical protein